MAERTLLQQPQHASGHLEAKVLADDEEAPAEAPGLAAEPEPEALIAESALEDALVDHTEGHGMNNSVMVTDLRTADAGAGAVAFNRSEENASVVQALNSSGMAASGRLNASEVEAANLTAARSSSGFSANTSLGAFEDLASLRENLSQTLNHSSEGSENVSVRRHTFDQELNISETAAENLTASRDATSQGLNISAAASANLTVLRHMMGQELNSSGVAAENLTATRTAIEEALNSTGTIAEYRSAERDAMGEALNSSIDIGQEGPNMRKRLMDSKKNIKNSIFNVNPMQAVAFIFLAILFSFWYGKILNEHYAYTW